MMNSLFLSALYKSSGKTTVAIGLAAALKARGTVVQPFKKGPDYIDPMWLGQAAGRDCRNLDFHTMTPDEITATFAAQAAGTDLALIEGNKGLYDGLDLEGQDSNAAMAAHLGAPVVLVIDTRGMTRGIAPVVLGYQAFGPELEIAGLILNQIGGARHEGKLRAAVEHFTDIPILGAIGRHPEMEITERHLGLVPTNEAGEAGKLINTIARIVADGVDLDRILAAARPATVAETVSATPAVGSRDLRIAIARDAAFGFYYPDDLEALERAGAELIPFDTLSDNRLPDADAVFFGGGFPETQAQALSANSSLRHDIKAALAAGMPAYAECGGLMYLARSLTCQGQRFDMVGAIPGDVVLHDRPVGRGYVVLDETDAAPWPPAGGDDDGTPVLPAHEFHYASLENLPADTTFAYTVKRGYGIDGHNDGIVMGHLLAAFTHQRNVAQNPWAERFTDFVRSKKGIEINKVSA
ncbi:MAG TPA: cobyrinate a,c-diamide synthase [Rhodospirillales bacterium]|jgi:cobyrinic acid a,c-diamide synthase|nr:cobyrinate a,c-diamide synthase [Rhodospirillales bacterium]